MNQKGILHKLMLLVILVAGFGLALTLPAWKRHQDEQHARRAVQTLQQLAQQERDFYAAQGFYTADLSSFQTPSSCRSVEVEGHLMLRCSGYDISLEQAHLLRARSLKYPQWFSLEIEERTPHCQFDAASVVGEHLCAVIHSK